MCWCCVYNLLVNPPSNNTEQQNIKIILIAGVPSSQVLPGFLVTAPPSVCVPDVIGVLTVWIETQKK